MFRFGKVPLQGAFPKETEQKGAVKGNETNGKITDDNCCGAWNRARRADNRESGERETRGRIEKRAGAASGGAFRRGEKS